jgi:glycosyltransferase involved in cell wall biosynthesis
MHIAFVIPTLDQIGGAEQQVILLAKGLAHRGRRVSVIALSGSGASAAKELETDQIDFLSLHMRKGLVDPRGWLGFRRWIKQHRPDVVHAHLPHAVLMARWTRLLSPFCVLIETIHSPATGGSLRGLGYRITRQQPDAVTSVSHTAAESWFSERMLDQSKLAVVPNGIDLDHWKRDAEVRQTTRRRLALGDEFVWLAVGRLEPVKDHATLLQAFAEVPPNARLFIAGAGRLEDELRCMVGKLNVEDRVRFLGFQSDVLPWMQAADGFLMSSRSEGLPLAFLEAAACKLPAVCTDIPAMRELVSNQCGFARVPVGDSDALASAMCEMMELDPRERSEIGKRLRRTVAARSSLSSILDRWEEIYDAMLALKPHPTRSGRTVPLLRGKSLQVQ